MIRQNKKIKINGGMTILELIVVLSVFAIISTVVIFNFGAFQAKVDIKNLASDIALQVVTAQKASLSGLLPSLAQQPSEIPGWKPSYGVYFNVVANNKSFTYFADLNDNAQYDGLPCTGGNECLSKITITKNNFISGLMVYYLNSTSASLNDLTITFTRPNSGAVFVSNSAILANVSYVQITIASPLGITSLIKLYSSGRVQVN
jgi:prepilin-type N-terminal cleavage/methylation domain-containing protein